jgi:hypothetical protein
MTVRWWRGAAMTAFHFVWYLLVAPWLGTFMISVVMYLVSEQYSLSNSVLMAMFVSSFGVFFSLAGGCIVSVVLLPVVLFVKSRVSLLAHFVGIPFLAWYSIPWGDQAIQDQQGFVVAVVVTLILLTIIVYHAVEVIYERAL